MLLTVPFDSLLLPSLPSFAFGAACLRAAVVITARPADRSALLLTSTGPGFLQVVLWDPFFLISSSTSSCGGYRCSRLGGRLGARLLGLRGECEERIIRYASYHREYDEISRNPVRRIVVFTMTRYVR